MKRSRKKKRALNGTWCQQKKGAAIPRGSFFVPRTQKKLSGGKRKHGEGGYNLSPQRYLPVLRKIGEAGIPEKNFFGRKQKKNCEVQKGEREDGDQAVHTKKKIWVEKTFQ